MGPNDPYRWQSSFAGLRFWIVLLVSFWLISVVGFGWLIKSALILLCLLLLLPILVVVGFRFWLQRLLVNSSCPSCGQSLLAVKGQKLQCPNCQEFLMVVDNTIRKSDSSFTTSSATMDVVDVDAIDVSSTETED